MSGHKTSAESVHLTSLLFLHTELDLFCTLGVELHTCEKTEAFLM